MAMDYLPTRIIVEVWLIHSPDEEQGCPEVAVASREFLGSDVIDLR